MLVPVEKIEPGAVVKTPKSLINSRYTQCETAVYGGGIQQNGMWTAYLYQPEEKNWINAWNGTELEVVEDREFPSKRAKEFIEGKRTLFSQGYSSGTDPEIFVVDEKEKLIPARKFLKSKKENATMFYDGVQAEFCPLPRTCLEGLKDYICNDMGYVLGAARKFNPKAKFTIQNSFRLSDEEMSALSDEDLTFRCSTSMNVYGDYGDQPDPRQYQWRFAGGHIHGGCRTKSAPVLEAIIRSLDGVLGVAGVSLAANLDNPERRRMYGRAGEFRLPKHGIEYRVLSNFWLTHPLIYHLTFELFRQAMKMGEQGLFSICWEGEEQDIRDIINWCDVDGARKMLKKNQPVIERMLAVNGQWNAGQMKKMIQTMFEGLEVVVKNPKDVEGNWFKTPGAVQWNQSSW